MSSNTVTEQHTEDDINVIRARLANEEEDKDVIDSLDEVHDVGVFCQVTSVYYTLNGQGWYAFPLCLRLILYRSTPQQHQEVHPHRSKKH